MVLEANCIVQSKAVAVATQAPASSSVTTTAVIHNILIHHKLILDILVLYKLVHDSRST